MKILFFVALSTLLLSCVALDNDQEISLYQNYKSYLKALKDRDYDATLAMLTRHNRNQFLNSESGENFNDFFPFFSSIDTVVATEVNYYQSFDDLKSCLTINGFDSLGEATSLNFEMLNENNNWKFNRVQMIYHQSKNAFLVSATCPPQS